MMKHFSKEHNEFRQRLREFLEKEVQPHISQWEEDGEIPLSIWKKMGDHGFLGLSYPKVYGGENLDYFFDVVFNEEMGKMNSGGFVITQQVVQYMSGPYILNYGSEQLKDTYLPSIISGDKVSCIAITEPEAGSDIANIQTTAEAEDDYYIVNGTKTFVTNGIQGSFAVTAVKKDMEAESKGISLLVIDLDSEGIHKTELKKLGWKSSDTAVLRFENVKVPKENLIGEEGQGFYYLMNGLQLERLCLVPSSLATMEYALDESLRYMANRKTFEKNLNKVQVLRHKIAQLTSEVEALKAFSYHGANLYNEGIYDVKLFASAKLIATELHEKVATQCLQIFGGNGFMEDHPLARMYRDTRAGTLSAGSSEMMKEIIAKVVIDKKEYKSLIIPNTETKRPTPFNEDHELFRASVKDFLKREVIPNLDQWEKDGEVPREVYEKFGEMGYFGLRFPEKYGGSDLDIWYEVVLHEELSRINSGGFAAAMGAHFFLAMVHVNGSGNEAQKLKYLTAGNEGKLIGCLAVTEPDTGSDVKSIRTSAVKEGDHYIINGAKTFITNGVNSDYIVAAVKTNPEAGYYGISMMLIERDRKGVSATKLNKLGWRASDTGEIGLDNVKVPVENLLGEENHGFFYIMQHFVSERLSIAAGSVSGAEYAIELTLDYMNQRAVFGKKIKEFQVLRHRIAQMTAEIECNKQFLYSIYDRHSNGEYLVKEASMAKLVCSQMLDRVTFECLQMFGGNGFMEDYPLARMWRDARLNQIGGGTSEILCEIISKMIVDEKNYSSKTA
ncbi:MAG: acyl-CoA dehydrogenase family protein [Aequorivita sp.]